MRGKGNWHNWQGCSSNRNSMQPNSTPLAAFHGAIRAIMDDEDGETHTAYKITEKTKAVVNLGSIPRYRISSDGGSIEPALTPESDRTSYALLIYETALAFPKLSKHLRDDLDQKIYELKNGEGCG